MPFEFSGCKSKIIIRYNKKSYSNINNYINISISEVFSTMKKFNIYNETTYNLKKEEKVIKSMLKHMIRYEKLKQIVKTMDKYHEHVQHKFISY